MVLKMTYLLTFHNNCQKNIKCTEIIKNYSIQKGDINLPNLVSQVNGIECKSIIKSKHNQKNMYN